MKTFTEEERYNYNLRPNSLVLDVGAYHGRFSKTIADKHHCDIDAFEPVPAHFNIAFETLKDIPRVRLSECAVGDGQTDTIEIGVSNDSSGVYSSGEQKVVAKQYSLRHVLHGHGDRPVDLLKLNCEGGEFPILFQAIKDGVIPRLRNIQVQFHHVFPEAETEYEFIRSQLLKTHRLTYDVPWCWQNYELL